MRLKFDICHGMYTYILRAILLSRGSLRQCKGVPSMLPSMVQIFRARVDRAHATRPPCRGKRPSMLTSEPDRDPTGFVLRARSCAHQRPAPQPHMMGEALRHLSCWRGTIVEWRHSKGLASSRSVGMRSPTMCLQPRKRRHVTSATLQGRGRHCPS